MALGCDTEALRDALATGGKCVAIMVDTPLQKYHYIEKDRLQSGLSKGTLIIEAAENGGTMHTANYALQQAKRLACYYHLLTQDVSGNLLLEQNGRTQTTNNDSNLLEFINTLKQEPDYQQIKLNI